LEAEDQAARSHGSVTSAMYTSSVSQLSKITFGIHMMETTWIVEPRNLEEITFCKEGLVDSLCRMVVGLNVGTIHGH
jgi:hypothetical protein